MSAEPVSAVNPRGPAKWRRALLRGFVLPLGCVAVPVAGLLAHHGFEQGVLPAPAPGQQVLDRRGRHLALFESRDAPGYGYWRLAQVPPRVARAMIALEDRRFHQHPGVDPVAVARAALQNVRANRRVSGASTIAMQVARMNGGPGPRGWWRKAQEMAVALVITGRYGRQAVLRNYLERVPYGNRLHGIAAAARLYLGKPVADLSWAEIAFLSAIPQAPALSNPYTPRGAARARQRGARALHELRASGVIDGAAFAVAEEQLRALRVLPRPHRDPDALHAVLALAPLVARDGPAAGQVTSELDLDLQRTAAHEVAGAVAAFAADGATHGAALVVDLERFAVRAWVGSGGGYQGDAGAIDFVRVSRSPGSTLKPFIYALALARGRIQPDSLLNDLPSASGFRNADQGFLGPMLPRQALANSRNLPAVHVLRRAGLDNTFWMLNRLGLHDARLPARHFGLGLALGAMPVTLERLVTAYGALAADGRLRPLRWLRDAGGAGVAVLPPFSTRLVTRFLADPQARLPAFQRLGNTDLPFLAALKTGTSQGHRDAWTVAWTPRTLVGVWLGRADHGPMRGVSGARAAAGLAGRILAEAGGGAVRNSGFEVPDGYRSVRLCATTGRRAHAGCARVVTEWLSGAPRQSPARRVAVDRRTGGRATAFTPARFVTVREVLDFPPAPGGHGREAVQHRSAVSDLVIVSPVDGLRVVRLPDVPAQRQSIALRHRAAGAVQWFVDGRPYLPRDPANPRWQLAPGRHRIGLAPAGAPRPTVTATVQVD